MDTTTIRAPRETTNQKNITKIRQKQLTTMKPPRHPLTQTKTNVDREPTKKKKPTKTKQQSKKRCIPTWSQNNNEYT